MGGMLRVMLRVMLGLGLEMARLGAHGHSISLTRARTPPRSRGKQVDPPIGSAHSKRSALQGRDWYWDWDWVQAGAWSMIDEGGLGVWSMQHRRVLHSVRLR